MDKPWKVISAFVGVFIAGAVFGGLFTLRASAKFFAYEERLDRGARAGYPKARPPGVVAGQPGNPPPPQGQPPPAGLPPRSGIAPALMRQIAQRVNPTPEQVKRIRVVVGRAADDMQRLQRESLQDTMRVMDRMYEDVSEVLSPDQKMQLEKHRQEYLERVRRDREKRGELAAKSNAARASGKLPAPEGSNPPAKD